MTNFKDVIDKVQEKKSRVDDNSIYDNLKVISKNTEALKPLSKNLEKLSKDMHTFVNTFKPSFFKKFEESERTYESKPSRISESINPSKVKDGEKEDKKGGFLKGFGVALLGGVGAYVASEDFKKAVNGMIDGIGEGLLGSKGWNDFKKKVDDAVDKTGSALENFGKNITSFDKFFGGIEKAWKEHWDDILLSVAGVSMALNPLKTLTSATELFKTLGGPSGVASIVGSILGEPLVLSTIITAVVGYLMYNSYKNPNPDISPVPGVLPQETVNTVTSESILKRRMEIAEEGLRTSQSKLNKVTSKDERVTVNNDIKHYQNDVRDLRKQLDDLRDSSRFKTPITPDPLGNLKGKWETNKPYILDSGNRLSDEDRAKKTADAALKNYLNKQSREPQKISVSDYNKEFGTTYASTDPVPYPTKINLGGDNVKTAMDFFMSNDFTKEQAAGIVGNLQVESGSGLNPTADNGSHYGIAQWDRTRESDFMKLYGKSIRDSSLMEQLEFLLQELPKNGLSAVKDAKTAEDAAIAFENKFERSGGQLMQKRINFANKLMGEDYKPTMEPSKNRPVNIPMAPQEEKSDGLLGSFNGLLSKLSGKGIITSEDIGGIKATASKEIGEISGRMQNILGGDLGSVNKSMREVQGASKVSPAPVIQTTNNQSSTPSGSSSGDIASPIDIDIAKLMMHVI